MRQRPLHRQSGGGRDGASYPPNLVSMPHGHHMWPACRSMHDGGMPTQGTGHMRLPRPLSMHFTVPNESAHLGARRMAAPRTAQSGPFCSLGCRVRADAAFPSATPGPHAAAFIN